MKWFGPDKSADRGGKRRLRRFSNRFASDASGASALEFAMVAPALIFMIIGVMQLGLALHKGTSVQWAAERAIRSAMLDRNVTGAEIQSLIEADLANLSGPSDSTGMSSNLNLTVQYTVDSTGPVPMGRVMVDYHYPVQLPLMDVFAANFSVDTTIPLPE